MSKQPEKRGPEKRGLGRGLSALMADMATDGASLAEAAGAAAPAAGGPRLGLQKLPVELLQPNPRQPRSDFEPEALDELARSIADKGVLQPLIVRPVPGSDRYEIVAGERRWRAAQRAQLHELPALVREFDDDETLQVALIENIQRAELNPMEEAAAFRQLMERFGHTQEKLSDALAKSRSHIANLLRLLTLPPEVQAHLRSGKLSMGHARALVMASAPGQLARQIIEKGLSVRETEKLVKAAEGASGNSRTQKKAISFHKDSDTRALESDLSAALGMKVGIAHETGSERGVLSIRYEDLEALDRLCRMISAGPPK